MKKQNTLFAFALLFSLWGLGQTAMAQKARKEVSRAQAKTLMLKQQKAEPSDLSCTLEYQVVDGVAFIDIPAGIYDYVVVNPTPGLCIVIPGIFGQTDDTYGDDFRFEAGKIYHFLVAFHDGGSFATTGDCVTLTVTDGTPFHPVQDLTGEIDADGDVILRWKAPTKKSEEVILLSEGFESVEHMGAPTSGWTTIDADGDSHCWQGMPSPYINLHGGNMTISSWSHDGQALSPNNYLISPKVEGATKLKFYYSVNDGYPGDHYAVMASSGTAVSDFQLLYEETPNGISKDAIRIGSTSNNGSKPQSGWIERAVNLPVGTKYIAFRHYNCTAQNYILIDDVEISAGNSVLGYTYTVYRDGYKIKEGLLETTYEDTDVPAGEHTYCVEVQYTGGVSPKACVDITVEPHAFNPVTGLTATQDGMDAVLQWVAPAGKDEIVLLKESFESVEYEGIPAGWIAVDADGDGKNWGVLLPAEPATAWVNPHNGEAVIGSFSWLGAALTPDNYLISPKVEGATKVKYYFAVNANYPAEHYAVMASSTGTNLSDFTLVFEETSTGSKIADIKRDEYSGQTEWIERTVDLPAGTKYVAFRHYNSTNQNFIVFDDIEISGSSPGPVYTYSIYRNNVQIASEVTETTYRDVNLIPGSYTYGVKVVYPNGESSVEEATLTIMSLPETVTTRPYTLTIHGHRISVTCRGEVCIYDMNGRFVVTGADMVEYTAQIGVYIIRISVDGRTYVEKVTVK